MNIKLAVLAPFVLALFGAGCMLADIRAVTPLPSTETKLVKEIHGVHLPGAKIVEIQASPSCPGGICPGLGNVFYLPDINALSVKTGGNRFFADTALGGCTQLSVAKGATRDFSYASSMQHFIKNTMSSADLSGDYKTAALTVKGSVQAMAEQSSAITSSFNSKTLDMTFVTHAVEFIQNSECFSRGNLDPALLQKFESLALIESDNVSNAASWSPYVEFLKTQGSHIMMQQQIGSRFQQWESSTSEESNIQSMLEAKAYAQVEGVSAAGGWSVKGCGAYSEEEKQIALKINTTSRNVIAGGTRETRASLAKGVTEQSLGAFIDSAEDGDQPVRHIFKPVWQLFASIFAVDCADDGPDSHACQNVQRAYNLQASFEGWTAVGCPHLEDSRKSTYQTMAIAGTTSQGINIYKCVASKTGCRSKADCSLPSWIEPSCYCHGQGCIDTGPQISGTELYRNQVRGSKKGGLREGVNNSCSYKLGTPCKCDTGWSGGLPERNLYLQSSE